MKILIADDDATIHASFTKTLISKGFEVLHAYDGKEALEIAEEQLPEIILLDLLMPNMDGRDVCIKLKRNLRTSHIHIIMLSSKDQEWDRELGLTLGADEYIDKPCDLVYLNLVINRILRKLEG